jgi:hypothetical protein
MRWQNAGVHARQTYLVDPLRAPKRFFKNLFLYRYTRAGMGRAASGFLFPCTVMRSSILRNACSAIADIGICWIGNDAPGSRKKEEVNLNEGGLGKYRSVETPRASEIKCDRSAKDVTATRSLIFWGVASYGCDVSCLPHIVDPGG